MLQQRDSCSATCNTAYFTPFTLNANQLGSFWHPTLIVIRLMWRIYSDIQSTHLTYHRWKVYKKSPLGGRWRHNFYQNSSFHQCSPPYNVSALLRKGIIVPVTTINTMAHFKTGLFKSRILPHLPKCQVAEVNTYKINYYLTFGTATEIIIEVYPSYVAN